VIAIVDDDESVRRAFLRAFDASGIPARGVSSGDEFLKNWRDNRLDCLVLDIHMPGLSGIEVQRELQAAGANIPVVIVTAYDNALEREEAMRMGAAAYLIKPLDMSDLITACRQACR
jgi:FixJ family two-component response regulator